MDQKTIVKAINDARKGIGQYLEIMRLFSDTNVSVNTDFQKKWPNPAGWYLEEVSKSALEFIISYGFHDN